LRDPTDRLSGYERKLVRYPDGRQQRVLIPGVAALNALLPFSFMTRP
jgi:hypothetical protein